MTWTSVYRLKISVIHINSSSRIRMFTTWRIVESNNRMKQIESELLRCQCVWQTTSSRPLPEALSISSRPNRCTRSCSSLFDHSSGVFFNWTVFPFPSTPFFFGLLLRLLEDPPALFGLLLRPLSAISKSFQEFPAARYRNFLGTSIDLAFLRILWIRVT